MLVPTSAIVEEAIRTGTGVGAFNVITLEHAEGIVTGAETAGKPVLLQISQNCVRFHGGRLLPIARAAAAVAAESSVPVALHLDHIEDELLLRQAADAGFASVMVDASTLPYAENVDATRHAVAWAHRAGLWVEAELGEVGGKDGAHAPGVRTDPHDAATFVADTGVDALAVAVGSSHAMTTRTAALDLDLIARLRGAVPVPLVLHGSSGVPDDQLRAAVRHGMVKINIGTALNVAFTGTIRDADLRSSDPRKYLAPARDAIAHTVAHLLGVLAGD
ncbi:class II fructose-bisphosphate aldolase [Actinosynnema sp. ALI-1.44]|uniref:class II fructose-bisphosphate aldolase n=1 Tax=Actinosynnema sp. ALI-1.44 TaxID=1933779 RepID=UPI001177D3C3|nr:class II fructose-bisphosphate aldolase [Actinosynnema sp. ALI-1.44]